MRRLPSWSSTVTPTVFTPAFANICSVSPRRNGRNSRRLPESFICRHRRCGANWRVKEQTFMAIKDSLRRDMAIEQLCTQRNILDIALELGFSETSAFYRAFKSWTGTLPGKYRRDSKQAGKRSIMDSELRVGKSR
ncbi:MAG: AraC family transcriptional regulator [Candidatus Competibacteraceae bacterium]